MRLTRRLGNWPNAALALCAGLTLSGCALSPFDEDGLFRRATTAVGATGRLVEPQPFVRETRPEETAYQPVGVTPKREADPRTVFGVQELEHSLRTQQAASVQQAARPVPPSPYDGKIEPGFRPPPPPPLPPDTGPKIELRGAQGAAAPVAATPAPRAAPAQRAPRKRTQEGADTH